jgi:hypothetical protein
MSRIGFLGLTCRDLVTWTPCKKISTGCPQKGTRNLCTWSIGIVKFLLNGIDFSHSEHILETEYEE